MDTRSARVHALTSKVLSSFLIINVIMLTILMEAKITLIILKDVIITFETIVRVI